MFTPPDTLHGYSTAGAEPMTIVDLHLWLLDDAGPSKLRLDVISEGTGGGLGSQSDAHGEQVYYIQSGSVDFTVGDEHAVVVEGSVGYVPQDVTYEYRNASAETLTMVLARSYDASSLGTMNLS